MPWEVVSHLTLFQDLCGAAYVRFSWNVSSTFPSPTPVALGMRWMSYHSIVLPQPSVLWRWLLPPELIVPSKSELAIWFIALGYPLLCVLPLL